MKVCGLKELVKTKLTPLEDPKCLKTTNSEKRQQTVMCNKFILKVRISRRSCKNTRIIIDQYPLILFSLYHRSISIWMISWCRSLHLHFAERLWLNQSKFFRPKPPSDFDLQTFIQLTQAIFFFHLHNNPIKSFFEYE